jgi:hypothetical protein
MALPSARNDTIAERERNGSVKVCAGGDVTLGTNLDAAWARKAAFTLQREYGRSDAPDELIAPLKSLFAGADIVLLNVESAIGSGRTPSKCGPKSKDCFAFRAPTAAARALATVAPGKIVIGNVANNHSHDAGNDGRDTTIALLTRAGVRVTGADTLATPVVSAAGDTIGVLGFYTSSDTPDARDTAAVYRHVARAVREYGVVIVTMHLGAEGANAQRTRDASEVFLRNIDRGNPVAFADAAVRGGASLVIGHGPHVLRAMEWRDHGALIAYSLGNLLTYGPFHLSEPMNRGAVLCTTLDATGRASAATLEPTMQRTAGLVQRDSTNRAIVLVDSLTRLDFRRTGASLQRDGSIRPVKF